MVFIDIGKTDMLGFWAVRVIWQNGNVTVTIRVNSWIKEFNKDETAPGGQILQNHQRRLNHESSRIYTNKFGLDESMHIRG